VTATASAPMLSVEGLAVNYGHVAAVKGIDLAVDAGAITTLVGANGAGTSTSLLALSGLVAKSGGRVVFDGEDITREPPHRIVARGLVQVAEGRATLTTLTVRENLELGAYAVKGGTRASREMDIERVFAMFPRLAERASGAAGNLSGGEQQMLAIGRALMARPRLLLLDEPSMGLAPLVVRDIFRTLTALNADGLAIFLVEQNVKQALRIAQRGYVIETGSIVMSDDARVLLGDARVREAYLGS
jgi:branched-chain amino acid transport system ATP-binding protein